MSHDPVMLASDISFVYHTPKAHFFEHSEFIQLSSAEDAKWRE